ncbi:MAG: hypothetical protein A2176_03505 [Spirochaetes bacterium RBG_13_51_14]|nr:MAG: hypothetical protein A2176_03505 [Spirochaetes bacterium RBG_13_51_14]
MNSVSLKIVLIFFLSLVSSVSLFASKPILIDKTLTMRNISGEIDYIEDAHKALTFTDIVQRTSLKWTGSSHRYINFGYTKSQFWFRFTVDNRTDATLPWLLEIDFPPLDLIELYAPDESGRYNVRTTGDTRPFSTRDVEDISYIFTMSQKPGAMTCYIRIDSLDSVNFNLNILSPDYYLTRLHNDIPIYWIYFGIMIIMALYNLSIFILTRDRGYIYFSIFIVIFALFEFNFKGFASQYLWPGATWWASHANPFLVCMIILSLDLFLIEFIGFKDRFPKLYFPVLTLIILIPSLFAIYTLFVNVQSGLMAIYGLTLFNLLQLGVIGTYVAFIQKPPSRQARIAIAAFSMYCVAIPIVVFTMLGFLPANFFTRWALQLGSAIVVLLFSLGLADKINMMRSIIQKAERKYRHLVESTADIIFTLDDDNNILSMNRAVKAHLRFEPEELINTNFTDLLHGSWDKNYDIKQQMLHEYISDLKKKKKVSARFRATMKDKYNHEPKEFTVHLEYTGDKDTGYAILGKASQVIDDALTNFLVSERYTYNLNNYLSNAELMSQRLVRNLYRFTDAPTISFIRTALCDAIINSIEHGNLKLTFEEKTAAQHDGSYFDLLKKRQMDPALNEKKVCVEYSLDEDGVVYEISDEGEGFDHKSMIEGDPENPDQSVLGHGRGILIIMHAFDVVKFNERGNQVLLIKYFKKF